MVKYILLEHYELLNTRCATIEVQNDGGGVLGTEHYEYGMDVPLAKVLAEVLGLLDLKYKTTVTDLGGTGAEL